MHYFVLLLERRTVGTIVGERVGCYMCILGLFNAFTNKDHNTTDGKVANTANNHLPANRNTSIPSYLVQNVG